MWGSQRRRCEGRLLARGERHGLRASRAGPNTWGDKGKQLRERLPRGSSSPRLSWSPPRVPRREPALAGWLYRTRRGTHGRGSAGGLIRSGELAVEGGGIDDSTSAPAFVAARLQHPVDVRALDDSSVVGGRLACTSVRPRSVIFDGTRRDDLLAGSTAARPRVLQLAHVDGRRTLLAYSVSGAGPLAAAGRRSAAGRTRQGAARRGQVAQRRQGQGDHFSGRRGRAKRRGDLLAARLWG